MYMINSSQWSNLLRKRAITASFYFPAEQESACLKTKQVSVNSTATILMGAFCNTHSGFHMEETA